MRVQVNDRGTVLLLDEAEQADVTRHLHDYGQTATVRWIARQWQIEGTEAFRVLKAVRAKRDKELLDRIQAQRQSPE